MLKTLKRDCWKLTIILLLCSVLGVLGNIDILRKIISILPESIVNTIHISSGVLFHVDLLAFITITLTFLYEILSQILPTCVHEQKKLWYIAWKYFVLKFLCFALFLILTSLYIKMTPKISFTIYLIIWSRFVIMSTLFLGFLSSAANTIGLWAGIKNLLTRHFVEWICVLILFLWLGSLLSGEIAFLSTILTIITNMTVVYICLPLLKRNA